MNFSRFVFCAWFTCLLAAATAGAQPATAEIITKAREFLGGDDALSKVKSIRYAGEFETADGGTGTIEIIFQKPLMQRVTVVRDNIGEVTALNDFEAWRKTYDASNADRWSITLLDVEKIRELQANTWENLNFFQGIEQRRGSIENRGLAEVDGRQAVELVFRHPSDIEFVRFFDIETGRLLMTRTRDGSEIRESGKIEVNGVVFPEKIVMSKDGEKMNEIRFTEVVLNQAFDPSLFDIPSFAPAAQ